MSLLKRRAVVLFASISLLVLGMIGFASTWQGSFSNPLAQKVSAAEAPAQPLIVGTCDVASAGSPIEVESSLPSGPTAYASLGAAFADINAGVHQGAVSVEVCFNSNEGTTPATLNSNGAGAALYASVSIRPLADGLTITGNPTTGFGIIQLNGADNVTIDGDNPNTGGTNRNLTVNNTTTTTVIANSVIRIATSAATPSADNNTFRNLNLNGNVTGGNSSLITAATTSSNSSFGVYVGAKGGATAITAPTNITSVATAMDAATTVNNLTVDNNAINQCARGIQFTGLNAASSTGITLTNNTIGASATLTGNAPFPAPATTVYTKGILIQGTTAYTISGNTVQSILSFIATTINGIEVATPIGAGTQTISNNTVNGVAQNSTAINVPRGIFVAVAGAPYTISGNTVNNIQIVGSGIASGTVVEGINVATTAASGTISGNKVSKVYNNNGGTTAARGINLGGGSNITVQNNFITDVLGNMTGGFSFDASFGTYGLRVASGTGHKIYHNTVHMTGVMLGSTSTNLLTGALVIVTTSQTGMDVRNNIFSNLVSGGTTSAHASIVLPTNSASAMTLTLNNNDYNSGPSVTTQAIGQGGFTVGTGVYLASNFNAAVNTPASNLRALTTLLGPATNDDASKVVDPLVASSTDPHLTGASPMIDAGVSVGLLVDIDAQVRPNGALPDIGADEFYPAPGVIQLSSAVYSGNEGTTLVATANRISGTSGIVGATYTLTNGSAIGGAVCGVGVDFVNPGPQFLVFPDGSGSQPINVTLCSDAVVDAAENFTITLSAPTGGATLGSPLVATATITDVPPPFSGSINVGSAEFYTSLTNPGGIFEAINLGGSTGAPITIVLTSDLINESGSVALNQVAGGSAVTIKPSAAPRTITSTAGAISVIKLSDADNVTIDGSVSGGTDRSLSITNANPAGSTAVIWLGSSVNGAQNNTVKNTILAGGFNHSTGTPVFNLGIISSTSASILTGGTDNDNNTFTNNFIKKVGVGIASIGGLASNMNQNNVISNNTIGPAAFGADQIATVGVLAFNENALNITGNEIRMIGDTALTGGSSNRDHVGIVLCGGAASWSGTSSPTIIGTITNGVIARNNIHDIVERGTFSAVGINENCTNGASPTSNSIVNNMLYNIQANGTAPDQGVAIALSQGNGDLIANNSINMVGDIDPGAAISSDTSSFGIMVQTTAVLNPSIRDNISVMNLTSNTVALLHAALSIPTGYSWGTGGSNNNDLYNANVQARVGVVGGSGGTFQPTLLGWQTATSQDAASISADPVFVSASNLHINSITSPVLSVGAPLAAVTNDYDSDPRPLITNPDIGADELVEADGPTFPSGTFYNANLAGGTPVAGNVTITNILTLSGGSNANMGANTLTIGCDATVTQVVPAVNYVVGNVRKDFCTAGSFTFPVGTVGNGSARSGEEAPEGFIGEYSPMTATINPSSILPSSLVVNVVDTWLPGLGQTSSTSRYWNVQEIGDITADMTFQYLPEDVYGVETAYKVFKWDGASTTQYVTGTVNDGLNQFTAPLVTSFSGWAAGVNAVTAATSNIGGRVLTTGGMPIANVKMVLTGGNLDGPMIVYTGSLGYYNFENLPVGQNYVVTVKSRRFFFSNPSQLHLLTDSINDGDFVADPQ
ncbi:MAG TPA: hypothetical protein VGO50_20290 [Pyrinomonadaceae bacterium]|jgi:hypothetical protein|nr:hypothetical protein [Pyrinomonadaceae bacterium]